MVLTLSLVHRVFWNGQVSHRGYQEIELRSIGWRVEWHITVYITIRIGLNGQHQISFEEFPEVVVPEAEILEGEAA